MASRSPEAPSGCPAGSALHTANEPSENTITDLLATVIAAHGGLENWNSFTSLKAHVRYGGAVWALKGAEGWLDEANVTVALREAWASHNPFGNAGRVSSFTPDRVTIADADGAIVEELIDPRSSFAGRRGEVPWSDGQLAYLSGCAMWTYLNMPFLLTYPGVKAKEIEPWYDSGVTWRRLEATFPETAATHCAIQTVHVAQSGLLARHDYDVEIVGGASAAHLVSDYVDVSGIRIPTKRRLFPRRPDGRTMPEPLLISIDLSDLELR